MKAFAVLALFALVACAAAGLVYSPAAYSAGYYAPSHSYGYSTYAAAPYVARSYVSSPYVASYAAPAAYYGGYASPYAYAPYGASYLLKK